MRRPDVLDDPLTATGVLSDLHGRRSRRRPHPPDEHHRPTLEHPLVRENAPNRSHHRRSQPCGRSGRQIVSQVRSDGRTWMARRVLPSWPCRFDPGHPLHLWMPPLSGGRPQIGAPRPRRRLSVGVGWLPLLTVPCFTYVPRPAPWGPAAPRGGGSCWRPGEPPDSRPNCTRSLGSIVHLCAPRYVGDPTLARLQAPLATRRHRRSGRLGRPLGRGG